MKYINLTQGKSTVVDDEDFNWLNQWKWHFGYKGYAARKPNSKVIYMHRVIIKAPIGLETDHINRDKLDNRKFNLRLVSRQTNSFNRGLNKNNTSGFRGVGWHEEKKKWRAYIRISYKYRHLGYFPTKNKASQVYNSVLQGVQDE